MVLAMAPMAAMLRFVRSARIGAVALALLLPATGCFGDTGAGTGVVASVVAQIDAGQFASATAQIGQALAQPAVDAKLRESLEFQRERMRRILLDFTLSEDDVKTRLRKQIPDLSDAEFAKWDSEGLFERRVIDGRVLYFSRSPSNLFRLSHEALARRKEQTPLVNSPLESPNPHHREVVDAALASHKSSVTPRHLRVTQSLSVHADAVPAGENVRAWIPYPRALPGQQEDIRFVSSEPAQHEIAPESTLQRTVLVEKRAEAGKPTKFSVTYELTVYAQRHTIDADKVVPATITPELAPFVSERSPHVVFTAVEPAFLPLRQETAFVDLVRELRLR